MTGFLETFLAHGQQTLLLHYPLVAVASVLLALLLRKTVPGMMLFVWQMLALVAALLISGSIAAGLGSMNLAHTLHGLAILVLGMVLIREICLIFFRLIVPRLGMRPPRILEELLILLAYGAWVLIRLSYAGLDPSSLVASTAVVTAILAFAMQDTLGNILAGLSLQLDHSVHIGDWIELDDISGQVVQVQWRHTAVRTLYGEMVLIPNSHLMKSRVVLMGGSSIPRRLRTVFFYAPFALRPAAVIEEIETALASAEFEMMAVSPPPVCLLHDFSGGVMTFAIRYWLLDPTSPGRADSLVRQHVHAVFQRQGWPMASPGMDVQLSRRLRHGDANDLSLPDEDETRLGLLRSSGLFTPLLEEELHELARRLRPMHYAVGSILARQGDTGDCLFVISRGTIAIWLEAHGSRHKLAELGAGEIVGEMSLMTGEPRRATIMAHTDLDCYVLDKPSFEAVLLQRPELAEAFAQLLAVRKRELSEIRDTMPAATTSDEKAALLARIRKLFHLG